MLCYLTRVIPGVKVVLVIILESASAAAHPHLRVRLLHYPDQLTVVEQSYYLSPSGYVCLLPFRPLPLHPFDSVAFPRCTNERQVSSDGGTLKAIN